ncbi:ROK family protein [Actomonas aquatica]|uniref:ROK family protein n=1 Tax=Actomonas aquatica TaxID=2866162 RepID=A0ABZ1CBE4_9BACT|nr:ROK family protein [Opitutus sp. WL0086]WRQ87894.1 ROK family protein [Opitutus sp. WL0086]
MNATASAPAGSYLGIDIGGTKVALCRWRPQGRLQRLDEFPSAGPDETFENIGARLRGRLPRDLVAIGIACGGPLDAKRGLILSPPNLPGWDEVPITRLLTHLTGAPSFLVNDANANALAEWRFGAGRDCDSLIYLTAGTGMGAGIVLNGRLVTGANGNAGEVGHWRLAARGPEGYHKRGSFEGYCSGGALPELVQYLPTAERPADWRVWRQAHPTAKAIGRAADAGDATAQAVLRLSGEKLGAALALLIDALDPECIVAGNLYRRCRRWLEPAMRRVINAEALSPGAQTCSIRSARLGERIGDYGAICAALHGLGVLG